MLSTRSARLRVLGSLFTLLSLVCLGCGDDDGAKGTPLRILISNDDGVAADGIDAIVEALRVDPQNEVTVCAPDGNRSGSADHTGPSELCGDLAVTTTTTKSGYPATAVNGCPADAVNYALTTLYDTATPPHVVLSGINAGQNVSMPITTRVSGTVGAARTAARQGIPALAASQGAPAIGSEYDYPAGVAAVLSWLGEHRSALLAGGVVPVDVDNLNVPSCAPGTAIRGTLVDVPLAPTANGALTAQDCSSTLENPQDDVEAFRNGFVTLSKVGVEN